MRKQCFRKVRRCPWRRLTLILSCVLLLMLTALIRCRPTLIAFAESQAVWMATKIANQTVADILVEYAERCRTMVQVCYTEDKSLSSVTPDSVAINAVRTAITDAVMKTLERQTTMSVAIPVGTLLGVDWLSGWGPLVTFPISFTSTVLSDVSSSLEAVGMNQSTYRVLIHLDISMYVVTPGGRSTVGAQLAYPMAEAVLLGDVPDSLTEVYGDDQSLLGKIFDYGTME